MNTECPSTPIKPGRGVSAPSDDRRRHRRFISLRSSAALAALALTVACASDAEERPTATGPVAADVDALAERYWDLLMRRSPMWATLVGDHRFDDRLPEGGVAARARFLDELRPMRAEAEALLRGIPTLDGERRITLELLGNSIQEEEQAEQLGIAVLAVDQMDGPQATFAYFVTTQHPMTTIVDGKNLLARYRAFPAYIDGIVSDLELGVSRKQTVPLFVVDRVVSQLDALVDGPLEMSPFALAAKRLPSSLAATERDALAKELTTEAERSVREGFRRFRTFLVDKYRSHARTEPGVSSIPDGARFYEYAARHHTTTTLLPDEIHTMGLNELERIENEMQALADERGFKGTVAEFLVALKEDARGQATSRASLLDAYKSSLDDAKKELSRMVTRLPKLDVEVREMDAARERDAPAAYYEPGTLKDRRPGIFIANLFRFEERPLMNARVLTFHEAIPGHHLQIAVAQELEQLPKFRREGHYSSYVEGWALYSEEFAGELGLYKTLEDKMGALGFAAWRASRLVVDTGLHAKGWSREHAIDFLAAHTTLGRVDVENEIDRYIVWPGQALSYMVGKLRLKALRKAMEDAQGTRFSLPAFHDVVLGSGPLPLDVMERHVRRTLVGE